MRVNKQCEGRGNVGVKGDTRAEPGKDRNLLQVANRPRNYWPRVGSLGMTASVVLLEMRLFSLACPAVLCGRL